MLASVMNRQSRESALVATTPDSPSFTRRAMASTHRMLVDPMPANSPTLNSRCPVWARFSA